jgi:competence ComEA-like helix-hairpin-helix protein
LLRAVVEKEIARHVNSPTLFRQVPARMVRVVVAAALVWSRAAPGSAAETPEKTALRCWRCGEVFTVLQEASAGHCPACRAVCKRTEEAGVFKLHCVDAGASCCSFVCRCPEGSTVVFIGAQKGEGERMAGYLAQLGVDGIEVLIGAEPDSECMRSVVELMKLFRIGQLFDPGFRNEDARYAEFIDLLKRKDIDYRVVRGMENLVRGTVRLYLVRAGSFAAGAAGGKSLSLCVIHGGNSFLLSRSARGGGASVQPPANADVPASLFTGALAELKAVGSPYGPKGALVLESNGTGIGVRSFGRIAISSGGEANAGGPSPASAGTAGGGRAKTAGGPAAKININKATSDELDALSGIGARKAATIIEFRETNGRFSRIEEIKKVPGIGEKLFQRNRDRICVD